MGYLATAHNSGNLFQSLAKIFMTLHRLTKTVNHLKISLELCIHCDKMVLTVQAGQTVCTHSYYIFLTVVVSDRLTWCWRRRFDKSLPMHCHVGLRHLQDQGLCLFQGRQRGVVDHDFSRFFNTHTTTIPEFCSDVKRELYFQNYL